MKVKKMFVIHINDKGLMKSKHKKINIEWYSGNIGKETN